MRCPYCLHPLKSLFGTAHHIGKKRVKQVSVSLKAVRDIF
ncbi:hypothetical protein ANACOL_01619 [Anaerotruncus colihominis DSM 17241]|uniref:Uncharacterized protein n=1 Tax=Anaerotruncus colihominis DSM 17241 TaxID=445972 RepID=B0PA50_9FIRM|nr:hypothetical protein ANACOL_01619 [Anaerotruncus colihominis DSM 17241]